MRLDRRVRSGIALLVIGLSIVVEAAGAQTTASPAFDQRLGARLPHQAVMLDETGQPVDWPRLESSGRPIVLLPAYYRCDTLCGTVAHGVLEALDRSGLPPSQWRLLFFSIDPDDTPADAAVLRSVYLDYARWLQRDQPATDPDVHLLTGPASASAAWADAIGFQWRRAAGAGTDVAHPTGLVVLTPDGRVSRYLFGVRFEPDQLRAALVEASSGRIGTLTDQLLLACSHLDPLSGRLDEQVMIVMRSVGLTSIAVLLTWIWRRRRTGRPT
jgi:protein SCO1/2